MIDLRLGDDINFEDAISKSLNAYGLEYQMREEAKKGGMYAVYCLHAAEYWLQEARKYRRIAEAQAQLQMDLVCSKLG